MKKKHYLCRQLMVILGIGPNLMPDDYTVKNKKTMARKAFNGCIASIHILQDIAAQKVVICSLCALERGGSNGE